MRPSGQFQKGGPGEERRNLRNASWNFVPEEIIF